MIASPRQEVVVSLLALIADFTEDTPDSLFGVDVGQDDTLSGYFSQGEELFEFQVAPKGEFSYVESDDRAVRSYLSGLQIQDSRDRRDRKPRCENSKPCGNGCIPRGHRCTQGLSRQQKQAAQGVKAIVQEQKQKGNWKKGAVIGGAIAAGVLGIGAIGLGAAIASSSAPSFQRPAPSPAPPKPLSPRLPSVQLPQSSQAILVTDPLANQTDRQRVPRPPRMTSATTPTNTAKGTQISGRQDPPLALLNPASPRLQNTTSPIDNPTLIPPPNQMVLVSNPKVEESPKGKTPRRKAARQASETSTPNTKANRSHLKPEIPANPRKKPPAKPPAKSAIEQQTEKLIHKHGQYATKAKVIADSKANPDAIAAAEQTLSRLDVRRRQMMNPLHESYFDTAAPEVKALSRQLAQADRAALDLKIRLLKGKTLDQHRQDSDRALADLDGHAKRIAFAQAAMGSVKKSPSNQAFESLQQQRNLIEERSRQVRSVQQAVDQVTTLHPRILDLQQKVAALPTRPNQLDEAAQAQHRQVQRIRTLQGKMPAKVGEFARLHRDQLDNLDQQVSLVDQTVTNHDTNRQYATQSLEGSIGRRQSLIEQDMHLLRLMAGKDGVKWVTGKNERDMPSGLELVIKRAQAETGTREIQTVEEAAKFRNHVMAQLSKRVEGYLGDIEQKADYPKQVSDRSVEQINTQIASLRELQNQSVIEGRSVSQGLVRDLGKTAQGVSIQLTGSSVLQPYRQANEYLIQDIQNAHAQKARSVAEAIVTAEAQRDRLMKIAKESTVFELGGIAKSTDQLAQDATAVRNEIKRMKLTTTVKLGNVQPSEETARRLATNQQRLVQNEVVRSQISHLQSQLGEVAQQIKKRTEAAERGQKKGINTGRLEAQRAAIERQMQELAQQFAGIEKRDGLTRSVKPSGIMERKQLKQLVSA